jgi:beta-glucosidase
MYYNHMPSKSGHHYVDMPNTPLWEFGYGLSYTKFEYSNLNLSAKEIGTRGSVEVSADISNVGRRAGKRWSSSMFGTW